MIHSSVVALTEVTLLQRETLSGVQVDVHRTDPNILRGRRRRGRYQGTYVSGQYTSVTCLFRSGSSSGLVK